VNRDRAVDLAEHLLRNLNSSQDEWPVSIISEVYVFGSFSRGALSPKDLDIDLEHERDERWNRHFVAALTSGSDPYTPIRKVLTTGRRGYQFTYEFRDRADFEMTLLWQRGDSLETALARLHAIKADPAAGRALRDSMLPQFEGIDEWIPRPYREALSTAVSSKAILIERKVLSDTSTISSAAAEHIAERWNPASPLYRAALAVAGYWEERGVDIGRCHLHGNDVRDRETPHFAGFNWRYFRSIPWCLTECGGIEWLEVVHPTKTRPLDCLRIVPLDKGKLSSTSWG
jgi:hypothetical protein